MIHLKDIRDGSIIFKALGSDVRLEILSLIAEHGQLKINDIATHLNLTKGALTSHIKLLQEANLINITMATGKKGTQKLCSLTHETLVADFKHSIKKDSVYELELDVGHYFNFDVTPTCGIATVDHVIGCFDDNRFFTHPDRINAGILWLAQGYVEYRIPNFLKPKQVIEELEISFELSSEAPGVNENYPSDIHFHINDVLLGFWTSPGDFGEPRGLLTPSWWYQDLNQFGLLKRLIINDSGTFIDGLKISDIDISQINTNHTADISLKIGVPNEAVNCGGLTLFGKGFGNYNQGIRVQIKWKEI
ncbi:ArsR/SmtB family transcription factor [Spirochaeta cellobiosiphila]|uniref:ArsR/SmtB family transcription factor n=1 Tax=Spirochaeta cellobiosiphila TaxID=504483 RepID=UPI0004124A21|nr:ArsR family transcriptional regulator [Spirochaeta cellobiosiphila]